MDHGWGGRGGHTVNGLALGVAELRHHGAWVTLPIKLVCPRAGSGLVPICRERGPLEWQSLDVRASAGAMVLRGTCRCKPAPPPPHPHTAMSSHTNGDAPAAMGHTPSISASGSARNMDIMSAGSCWAPTRSEPRALPDLRPAVEAGAAMPGPFSQPHPEHSE